MATLRESSSSARIRAALTLTIALATLLFVAVGTPRASGTFAPTIKMETSTTRATAHPDARITIDNSASSDNIKNLTLQLPDGFWGSLAAVTTKCTEAQATAGTCPLASKIGSVTASADIIDGDTTANGVLTGGVYLTEAFAANAGTDPAGISIKVDTKVGGVDLGKVIVHGRAIPVYSAAPTAGTAGTLKGLKTVVTDIPQSVIDTAHTPNRTVDYKLDKMTIDLISTLKDSTVGGYTPPLLTNPSTCGTYSISADAAPYGGGPTESISDPYTVDQCGTVRFQPSISNTFSDAVLPSPDVEGLVSTVTMPSTPGQPAEGGAISDVEFRLPRGLSTNFTALAASNICPGNAAGNPAGVPYFIVANCLLATRPQAKIGEMTLTTPLLDQPVKGYVYLINKTPVPWLGVNVSDSIPGNPKGINFQLVGINTLGYYDPACNPACGRSIVSNFSGLPDAPLTSAVINLDMGDRTRPDNATVSGKIFEVADDGNCQPVADSVAHFASHSGATRDRVQSQAFSGCPPKTVTPGSGPWGQETSDTTPTFDFNYSGSGAQLWCGVDSFGETGPTGSTDCTGATSYTPLALGTGLHTIGIGDNASPSSGTGLGGIIRNFVVNTSSPQDTTVPTTTLNIVPATTADTTPGFTFNASETSTFQCSLDDGAFLPCGSATGTADANYSIPSGEALFASDDTHTFAVRAQDTAGNVDLMPASATFKVVIPFAPTMAVNLTTTQARAHPEMTLSISNSSHEDLEDFTLKLPDGFFGGLTGVAGLCSITDANAGTCGAGSEVGTVDATAVIDRSTVTTVGKVYLTDPRPANLGDPAGLTIVVKPKLQDVTFEPILVNARLMVRGQAQGIDTVTVDIPNTATSTIGEVSNFDMRSITLHLKDNNLAPKQLLTNPSSCDAKAFTASFTGSAATPGSASVPFTATGCGALGFSPALSITQVERSTGGNPGPSNNIKRATIDLTANLSADPNGSGIKSVNLTMPQPITIDVQRLPFPCTDDQAAAKACPASSAIGTVSATTPLLNEAESGNVYVLKSQTSLPRLLIALRGRIDVDLIATNSFLNAATKPQIVTHMDTLPDVPLSTFSMKINGFLTTRDNTCETGPPDWNITGTMAGFSGSNSAVAIPLSFNCPNSAGPIFNYKLKGKGSKTSLTMNFTAQGSQLLKKVTVKLPKGLSFNKKGFTKKKIAKLLVLRGDDGKKLKTKCFKKRSSTTFELNFCNKKVFEASVQFKSGTLIMKKKIKKPKFKVTVVGSDNARKSAKFAK